MIERINDLNDLLELNDVMCRIGSNWYRLDEIHVNDGKMPIFVSDDDGEEHEFDMVDIEEFDPIFEAFREMDMTNIGIA